MSGDFRVSLYKTGLRSPNVAKKLCFFRGGQNLPPSSLRLDVAGLSWLTCLSNITWSSGIEPLDWQTFVVGSLFKNAHSHPGFYVK